MDLQFIRSNFQTIIDLDAELARLISEYVSLKESLHALIKIEHNEHFVDVVKELAVDASHVLMHINSMLLIVVEIVKRLHELRNSELSSESLKSLVNLLLGLFRNQRLKLYGITTLLKNM